MSKLRIHKKEERGNYRIGVDQQLGNNRAWAPLTGTHKTFTTKEQLDAYQKSLEKTYEWYLTNCCYECDTPAESENQKKCHFCGAKLPVIEKKPEPIMPRVEVPEGDIEYMVTLDNPRRGRPKKSG